MKKRARKKTVFFKPIHFLLLLAIDGVILAGVIIPQHTNIENAQLLLEETQSELNAIKIEYEREQANLEYMQTDEYKLQQGSVRYGWHYTDDTIILDDMSHYTLVKTTHFNGVPHPDIAVVPADGSVQVVRPFSYTDFESRLG